MTPEDKEFKEAQQRALALQLAVQHHTGRTVTDNDVKATAEVFYDFLSTNKVAA